MSVCLGVCLCVCLSVYTITHCSIHLKLEHTIYGNSVVYWALSDQGQGHGLTLKLSSPVSQLWHMLGSCDFC